jgi:hypothetical protein
MERLEKELQVDRRSIGEDRTMALERRDLHEMLRETQLQAESLEVLVKERESTITAITTTESELRSQLKRLRDERATQREKGVQAHEELDSLERKFRRAREGWEAEKKALSKGVRFPNMSVSEIRGSETLIREGEERERRHTKELRGLAMQIEWLRARCRREEGLRADAAYAKRFMLLQVELFGAWYVIYIPLLTIWGKLGANYLVAMRRICNSYSRLVSRQTRRSMRNALRYEAWRL